MKLRLLVILLLLIVLPSSLYARWIKDRVSFNTESVGTVEFSHYNHLEAIGNNCPTCHNQVFHVVTSKNPTVTMAEMAKGKSCGACHNGRQAFSVKQDCSTCHPTRDILFKEEETGDVTFSHDAHTAMFGCRECHPDLFTPGKGNPRVTMDQMAEGASCGACHDGSTAFSVEEDCENCHQME